MEHLLIDQDTDHTPALLFDLDGTLIDSIYQHVLAWHEGLKSWACPWLCGAFIVASA
jgi:hypothetical protein